MKKKNYKKRMQDTVSVSLAGAMLLTSCSQPELTTINDSDFSGVTKLPARQSSTNALDSMLDSCAIPLTTDDLNLINLTHQLLNDILNNPQVAQEFASDPHAYMAANNCAYDGDLNVGLIQMAIAAADPAIRTAIEEQDIVSFLDLCEQRGILTLPTGLQEISYSNLYVDDVSLAQYLSENGYSQTLNEAFEENNSAIAVMSVVATHFIVLAAVAALIVAAVGPVAIGVESMETDFDNMEISPLSLWLFNSNADNTYIPVNEWINRQYEQIDPILQETSSRYANDEAFRVDTEKIIKANLVKAVL